MLPFLNLKRVISRAEPVDPDDARALNETLARLDLRRVDGAEPPDIVDGQTLRGIRTLQGAEGLKVDGVVKPGGPTEAIMNSLLFEREGGSEDATPLIRLDGAVGCNGADRPEDVAGARRALFRTGFLDRETADDDTPGDPALRLAIQRFQRDFNLEPDATMTPGGETEQTLDRVLRTRSAQTMGGEGLMVGDEDAGPARGNDKADRRDGRAPAGAPTRPERIVSRAEAEQVDRLDGWIDNLAAESGLSEDEIREVGILAASLVPGVGEAISAKEAYDAFRAAATALENDALGTFLVEAGTGTLAAIGAIPVVGGSIRLGKVGLKAAGLLYRKLLGRTARRVDEVARGGRVPAGLEIELDKGPRVFTGRSFEREVLDDLNRALNRIGDRKVRAATNKLVDGGTLSTDTKARDIIANIDKSGGATAADAAFFQVVRDLGGKPTDIRRPDSGTLIFKAVDGTIFARFLAKSGDESVVAHIPKGVDPKKAFKTNKFNVKVRFPEKPAP